MRKPLVYISGLVLLLAISGFAGFSRQDCLRVKTADGATVLVTSLPEDSEFAVRFIHSVAKSPVEDWYSARNGLIALNRTVYQDFGAGLPHEAGTGQKMEFRDGHIEISGYTLTLPQMDVRVGRVAQHHLLLPENGTHRSFPLDTLALPGSALTFTVENEFLVMALWRQWMRVLHN